jgi:hypothetical protein
VYPLRELVQTTTIERDHAAAFDSLLSKLRESYIDVEMADEPRGLIVARCLALLANWIFWRAYGDKLLFEVKGMGPTKTEVKVYAIPNLRRYRVWKNEKALDWAELTRLVRRLLA